MHINEITFLPNGQFTKKGNFSGMATSFIYEFKNDSKAKILGKMKEGIVAYTMHSDFPAVAIIDNNTKRPIIVSRMYRGSSKNASAYCIDTTVVSPKYLGTGLATKLYAWLILKQNWIIQSGREQTVGGSMIWQKLYSVPGIQVYAWDKKKKQAVHIELEDFDYGDEIYAELAIRNDEKYDTTALENVLKKLRQKQNSIDKQLGQLVGKDYFNNVDSINSIFKFKRESTDPKEVALANRLLGYRYTVNRKIDDITYYLEHQGSITHAPIQPNNIVLIACKK